MISSKKSHVMIMLTANNSSRLQSNLVNMADSLYESIFYDFRPSDFWSFPHEFISSFPNRHWARPRQHLIKLGLLCLKTSEQTPHGGLNYKKIVDPLGPKKNRSIWSKAVYLFGKLYLSQLEAVISNLMLDWCRASFRCYNKIVN